MNKKRLKGGTLSEVVLRATKFFHKNKNGLKVGIIGGVITWLLMDYLLKAALENVWNTVLGIENLSQCVYLNIICRIAAKMPESNLTRIVAILIMIVVVGSVWLYLVATKFTPSGRPPEGRLKEFMKTVAYFSGCGIFGVFLVLCSVTTDTMRISASFTQRLTILTPVISDIECKTLRAQWASMRGKADYEALVTSMDKRAAALGIALPPVREL
jgi:uncharacterized membrane protein